jgi:hypothetical protein
MTKTELLAWIERMDALEDELARAEGRYKAREDLVKRGDTASEELTKFHCWLRTRRRSTAMKSWWPEEWK